MARISRKQFFAEIDDLTDQVFSDHPELIDHREQYPGLTCSLGDPFAPVWFVAENPSSRRLTPGSVPTREDQWSISRGDLLFREKLAKYGFKQRGPLTRGGWRCYITDVIKTPSPVNEWNKAGTQAHNAAAEAWAPVLNFELSHGQPRIVVVLGEKAEKRLAHLLRGGLIPEIPKPKRIHHYTYLGDRAEGRLGPMNADRVARWDAEFRKIARLVGQRQGGRVAGT